MRFARRSWLALRGGDGRDVHARELSWHLRSIRAQVVLAEYGRTGTQLMKACELADVPLVVHFHGVDAYSRETLSQTHQAYSRLFRQAVAVVAVSDHMRDQLIRLGAPAAKIHVIPYGVDLSLFEGARPDLAPRHFLAVGRFVEKKAPHITLLAFRQILQNTPTRV